MNSAGLRTELLRRCENDVDERVKRYGLVEPHGIIPNRHFASASSECSLLFRDGHYYGCVSLVQGVAEALVRFICEKRFGSAHSNFERNVRNLTKQAHISADDSVALMEIWEQRDTYHHINADIEIGRSELEELAMRKTRRLVEVEGSIFAHGFNEGRIVPSNPDLWDIQDDRTDVFLRLDPGGR
jgi:hypothetical protein